MSSVDITVVADAEEAARIVAERLADQARAGGSDRPHRRLDAAPRIRARRRARARLEPRPAVVGRRALRATRRRALELRAGQGRAARPTRTATRRNPPHAGELGRDDGTTEYEHELAGVGVFDLVLVGLGPDGHVASLFPGFPALDVTGCAVVGSEAGYEPFVDRISLTLPRLCATRELLFLVAGEDKADAVARALAGEPSHETPGSLARAADGETRAVLDRAAAAKL